MCACSLAALASKLKKQSTNRQLVQGPVEGSETARQLRSWVHDESTGLTAYHRSSVAGGGTEAIAWARWDRPYDRPTTTGSRATLYDLRRLYLGLRSTMPLR